MTTINDLHTELLSFNSHPLVCGIREKYNTPSFFEMIDKTRSETAHSAFISWMLKGQGISETTADTPLYLFLSVLAKRSLQQETTTPLMNPVVRDAILSRKINISNVETETEKCVSELAELAYDSYDPTIDAAKCNYLSQIIATVADRVDIVAKCDVENCDGIKHLILVIENKIDSPEGTAKAIAKRKGMFMPTQYTSLYQTERYYETSCHKNTSDTAVIYVFLTPKATMSDFASIRSNRATLKHDGKIAQSDNYININYQDILNGVIDNALLLQEGSITKRTKNFIEEYKNEITYPHIDNPKTHTNIAYPQIDGIEDLWERFRFLFHCIAYSTISNKGCVAVKNVSKTSYCTTYQNRVLNIPTSLQNLFIRRGSPVQSTSISNFCSVLSQNNIMTQLINSDELLSAGVFNLLSDFADENLEILSTIIGAVKFSSPKYVGEADELFTVLMSSARDNTKYFVSHNGNSLTPKPVSKSEVAYLIFKEWAIENNANLGQMRNAFPVKINPYYASGKYFQHLFYSYSPANNYKFDGNNPKFGNNVPYTGNWDFYHDNQHEYNGITNLKMWRKDAFDSLIDYVKNELSDFGHQLAIVDTLGNVVL